MAIGIEGAENKENAVVKGSAQRHNDSNVIMSRKGTEAQRIKKTLWLKVARNGTTTATLLCLAKARRRRE
jgi:hypothetical protein